MMGEASREKKKLQRMLGNTARSIRGTTGRGGEEEEEETQEDAGGHDEEQEEEEEEQKGEVGHAQEAGGGWETKGGGTLSYGQPSRAATDFQTFSARCGGRRRYD
eukprot:2345062-Pyramimonas_sp.AAC.1